MYPERSEAARIDTDADQAALATGPLATGPSDVLALVTSTSPWSPAAVAGVSLAARWGSNLTGCFMDPSTRGLHDTDREPTVLGLLMDPPTHDADAHAAFGAFARQSGVREATWAASHTGLARTLRHLGAWHDLAVVERDVVDTSGVLDVLGEAILGSQLPCLILPPRWSGGFGFGHVVIGCNGSIESIRAIHAALPFLRMAKQVTLVDGDVRMSYDAESCLPHFDPFVYLLRHHVTAKPQYIRASSDVAGDILLKKARDAQIDLLVMGAFGHSPARERVFGGATRRVLEEADIPVLMQH